MLLSEHSRESIMRSKRDARLLANIAGLFFAVILFLVFFVGGLYFTVSKGNFWCNEKSVLKALQVKHPEVVSVQLIKRKPWKRSQIVVIKEDGVQKTFYLDSNIFWDYTFYESEK